MKLVPKKLLSLLCVLLSRCSGYVVRHKIYLLAFTVSKYKISIVHYVHFFNSFILQHFKIYNAHMKYLHLDINIFDFAIAVALNFFFIISVIHQSFEL